MINNQSIAARYLTCEQAATYLALSKWSLYRLVNQRQIPFIPLKPSITPSQGAKRPTLRFDIRALDAWMENQTVKSLDLIEKAM